MPNSTHRRRPAADSTTSNTGLPLAAKRRTSTTSAETQGFPSHSPREREVDEEGFKRRHDCLPAAQGGR